MNGPRATHVAIETLDWKDVWSSDPVHTTPTSPDVYAAEGVAALEDSQAAALRLRDALIRHDLLITGIDQYARQSRRQRRT